LAVVLSVVAAVIALGLHAVGGVSQTALVLTVMASWVQTGRISRSTAHHAAHRLTVVPIRHPVS
jgi:hypothetical protein